MTTGAAPASTLSGPDLQRVFASAAAWLERNAASVNAINVFPVPDGDTGTNMALTLRAAVQAAAAAGNSLGALLPALARGALMGARGNSGVILSQYLRGLVAVLTQAEAVSGDVLARALAEAANTAYQSVARPAEGTILTVARGAAEAAEHAARAREGASADAILDAAVTGAREALARTPDLLPVLREAGVVDSGGLGLCVVLEGARFGLRGEELPEAAGEAGSIKQDWLSARREAHGDSEAEFGYCVEFTVKGSAMGADTLRQSLDPLGGSLLVVGDDDLYHVHIHALDPGPVLSVGAGAGRLTGVKVEDMDEQAARLAARTAPVLIGGYAVIAVAAGDGLAEALREAGAAVVVTGGQTMNPSTRDLLDAVNAVQAERMVILPNNKNIIWTAEQAAGLSDKPALVIPTRSIPQGLAALLALNPDDEPERVQAAMTAAAARVRTLEVTRAARSVTFNGVAVREGEPIALVDDELVASQPTDVEAALTALQTLPVAPGSLITIFRGAEADDATVSTLEQEIHRHWPDTELDIRFGGQPFYSFIISVE